MTDVSDLSDSCDLSDLSHLGHLGMSHYARAREAYWRDLAIETLLELAAARELIAERDLIGWTNAYRLLGGSGPSICGQERD